MSKKRKEYVRIFHTESGELLAEGNVGWDITPFEGNYYIRKKNVKAQSFRISYIPGLCTYKFFYTWLHYKKGDIESKSLGWKYFLPNPLFPFIWFRLALPKHHPAIRIETATDAVEN